ncbi:hypothetical protein AAMO2058_001474900 [Amorphochlora amoebiformis]
MGLRFWSTVTYRFLSRVPSRPLRLGRRAMMGNIRLSRHQANWGTLEDRSSGYSRGFATQGEGPASPSDGKKEEIKGGKDAKQEVGHLRQLWDKYGWIGIGTYVGIDVVTLGGFYAAILYGVDVKALLESFRVLEWMETLGMSKDMLDSKGTKLFTAWALYSAVAPVRFALVFAFTPAVQRFLTYRKNRKERTERNKQDSSKQNQREEKQP